MNIQPFTKTYGSLTALRFSGMTLERGRIVAVIGANGSGKSTLCKALAQVERTDQRRAPLIGVSVGYLPQKSFAFRMSLGRNLRLNGADRDRAAALSDALGIAALKRKRADRLSGGETARMALARLLMRDYVLVLLDEPTAEMDMESTIAAERLIRAYVQQTDCALLLVTHSLQQARRIADTALYLEKGEPVEFGPADEVLYRPKEAKTQRFLEFYGFKES